MVSCGFYRVSDDVLLTWPPGELPLFEGGEPAFWNLTWLSSDGAVSRQRVAGGTQPVVQLPREVPVIITAAPVIPDFLLPYRIRPAGCVMSVDCPRLSEMSLNWEQGFAADYLLDLAGLGIRPDAVNIRRFLEAVEERSKGNPWALDLKRLSSELLEGDLWIYSFRLLSMMDISIPLPGGSWYNEYPPDPVFVSEFGNWRGELSVGLHHFIRPSDGMVSTVSIDERGDVIVLLELPSGNQEAVGLKQFRIDF